MTSRKVVQKFGGLTARDAQLIIEAKQRKAETAEAKRQQKARDKIWRDEKKAKYREGVEARKLERQRKKQVKEFVEAKQPVPPALLVPIPDSEKIWLAEQEQLESQLQELQRQRQQDDDEEVIFTIDTVGDQSFQPVDDYIPLPGDSEMEDSENSTSDLDSELYDSDKDYSWVGRYHGK